jgi:hypothetical protein
MSQIYKPLTSSGPIPPNIPTSFQTDSGVAVPAANILNVFGGTTLAGTTPLHTTGAGNTVTIDAQITQAIAASNASNIGMAAFNSAQFTVDANGFVSLIGSSAAIERVNLQTGTTPIVPLAGAITFNGAVVAAGLFPVRTDGTGANTMALEVQLSQAFASSVQARAGLASFDSSRFTVDLNGFVTLNGAGAGETITGDSGGALSPTAGNWNILGRSGSKTSGAVSTLTIKSPPYADAGSSTTTTLNSGSFVTAAITLTLPASAGLIDGDLFEYICTTTGALVIQAVGAQKIRFGTLLSSAAGSLTSTSIGDSVTLRFRATDGFFYTTASIGTWLVA